MTLEFDLARVIHRAIRVGMTGRRHTCSCWDAESRAVMADQIVILQASAVPPRQIPGEHTGSRYDSVAITVQSNDEAPLSFSPGEAVVLVRNGPDGRSAVRSTFLRYDQDRVWFEAPGNGWPVVDERQPKRAVVDTACEVVGASLGEKVSGTIMDISEGGARISVPQHVGESRLDLRFVESEEPVSVPAVLLACIKEEDHSELRVRFDKLDRKQETSVRRYIDRWVKERKAS